MAKVGVDIVDVSRIERLVSRSRFLTKVFTEREIDYFKSKNYKVETIAGSFSAKEAVSKVFGTGIGKVSFKDIEILRDDKGKPYILLSDEGEKIAEEKNITRIDISISHEKSYAVAVATADEGRLIKYQRPKDLPPLKERPQNSHKGTFGKVGLIGGSQGMAGSILLASKAAMRAGSGLVYSFVPGSISQVVQINSLENIVYTFGDKNFSINCINDILEKAEGLDGLAFGPGLGREDDIFYILIELLKLDVPMVLDADGLYAAARDVSMLRDKNVIITPHNMEMARLVNKDLREIEDNPLEIAIETAKLYNITVVLKGHQTIVTNGDEAFINNTGNSGMATAGSGDVLTGIIGSLLGQGYDLYNAGVLGVHIHGLAGDFANLELCQDSVLARDIIANISNAIREIRQ